LDRKTNWENVCTHSFINNEIDFLQILIKYDIKKLLYDTYKLEWKHYGKQHKLLMIHGLHYEGSTDCQVGSGNLYAITKYNKQDSREKSVKPRHDFILINQGEQEHNQEPILGCIILMFEISPTKAQTNNVDEEVKIFLIVQHSTKCNLTSANEGKTLGVAYNERPVRKTEPNLVTI